MKKKILFVYDSMMIGGTSTALLSLMQALDREKFDISLLLYTNTGELLSEIPDFVHILEPAYKPLRYLDSRKRKIIRTVLNGNVFLALSALLKYRNTPKGNFRGILMHYGMKSQVSLSRVVREHYDYAIGFMEGWANQYVASGKISAKQKYVWVHPQYKSCYLIPEIDRKIFKRVDGIALVSEKCTDQFVEFFPEFRDKIRILPNIISQEYLWKKAGCASVPIHKAKINFCTVSRCDIKVKGLDRLLDVFCSLKAEGLCKDVLWHFIGGGSDLERFRAEVESRNMTDTVVLYGNQKNPLPYVCQMDAFVLASRYEGKPISVTEAQILGLPCMVTRYESAPSQVKDHYNGVIMDNTYESIYKHIKTVIQNPSLLNEWRENTVCESYTNEYDIDKFYALLGNQLEEEH